MKYLAGLMFLKTVIFPLWTKADLECEKHPIYCQIVKNSPKINKKYAMKLSNIIYKMAKKHKGDARLAVAIATQETGLSEINRLGKIIIFTGNNWKVVTGATDVCMFQFHVNTILAYKIDALQLKNNIVYCIEWHFKLMNIKKKYCSHMKKPWACYHSKTKVLRERYIKLVERYL